MSKFGSQLVVSFLLIVGDVRYASLKAADVQAPTGITGAVDHVLATLPAARFNAVAKFLSENFGGCWKPVESSFKGSLSKGFILTGDGQTYVELWNAGVSHQVGYQIGVTSNDTNAGETAKRHFGFDGIILSGMFTVGADGPIGHPVGGTFFVDYNGKRSALQRDENRKLVDLKELITAIPAERLNVQKDYEFYKFAIKPTASGFTATDKTGFVVKIVKVPTKDLFTSFGHVALHFHLKDAHVGKEVVKIDDHSKAIYDGQDFFLILQSDVFDSLKVQ